MTDYRLYKVNKGNIFVTDTENQLYCQPGIYLVTLDTNSRGWLLSRKEHLDKTFLSIGTTVDALDITEDRSSYTIDDTLYPRIIDRAEVSERDFLDSYFPFLKDEQAYTSSLQKIEEAYHADLEKLNSRKSAQVAQLGPKPTLDDRFKAFFKE